MLCARAESHRGASVWLFVSRAMAEPYNVLFLWCFRVAHRMLRTSVSDDAGVALDFCLVSQQRAGRVMMPAAVTSGRPFLSWSLRP